MERLRIAVKVPLMRAVESGEAEWGDTELEVTGDQIRELTRDEGRELVKFVVKEDGRHKTLRLKEAPATWDAVAATIRQICRKQGQAEQSNWEDRERAKRERKESTPRVAALFRSWFEIDPRLPDASVIENTVPALMEEVVDRVKALGVPTDHIRIVPTDSDQWKKLNVSSRDAASEKAESTRKLAEEVMRKSLPECDETLVRYEVFVARIRERSREDNVMRAPTTHVVAMLHSPAFPSTALLIRSDDRHS